MTRHTSFANSMGKCAFAMLFLIAASIGVHANSACLQNEHGTNACLDDPTSLLQTASVVHKHGDESNTLVAAPLFSACGCSCTIADQIEMVLTNLGYPASKIDSMINAGKCKVDKTKDILEKEVDKLKEQYPGVSVPAGAWDGLKPGGTCQGLLDAFLNILPAMAKQFLPMANPQCTGTLEVTAYAKPEGPPRLEDEPRQPEGTDRMPDMPRPMPDDPDTMEDEPKKPKHEMFADALRTKAKKNIGHTLSWADVITARPMHDLTRDQIVRMERMFAETDEDHDLTLRDGEVVRFVNSVHSKIDAAMRGAMASGK